MSSERAGLLAPPAPWPQEGVEAWWPRMREVLARAPRPFDAAVIAGQRADRLGYAFAGAYQAALLALLPGRDPQRAGALCVTEEGGNHPRAIATELRDDGVSGHKRYVTLGALAEELYVLARVGEAGGRPLLAMLRVEAGAEGVSLAPGATAPFVPEIGHASLTLRNVRAHERLEGDGWDAYAKPFRTVEDLLVHAAVIAHLIALGARWSWERALLERALTLLAALEALAAREPGDLEAQVALAGALEVGAGLFDSARQQPWPDEAARERWARDLPLTKVAAKARAARATRAWQSFGR